MRMLCLTLMFFAVATFEANSEPLHDAAKQGDTAKIAKLLDEGADINQIKFLTPLQMAALGGHAEAVELFASRGADVDAASSAMGTALHVAAQRGYADVALILLEAGANIDSRNPDKFTPLMVASLYGRLDVVNALIDAGADIDAIGVARSNGMGGYGNVNALHVASFKGDTEESAALIEAGAGPRPIVKDRSKLAEGDATLGQELTQKWCSNCHQTSVESKPLDKPQNGPSLIGVYGRPIASISSFGYTQALKRMTGAWSSELLHSYASEAMLAAPGTRMRWNDGWTEEDVAHIVAYLASVSK